MDKYTLADFRTIRILGDESYGIASIYVDTADDLPNPPPKKWTRGSVAFVIDTSETYILNSEGEWKKWQ